MKAVGLVREVGAASLQEEWVGERGSGIRVLMVVEWVWCLKALVWGVVVLG